MKTAILTFSQTGNTLKVGNAISEGLRTKGHETEQTRYLHRKKWNPANADLIGLGCPVFENLPTENVLDYLRESNHDFEGKKAFVFITSGGSPGKSLWRLAKAVKQAGADVIGGIQIRGAVTVPTKFGEFIDRPNADDLRQAKEFGVAVADHLTDKAELPSQFQIDPNEGGRLYDVLGPCLTYLKKKITPLATCDETKCDLCGTCVFECPTNCIKIRNKKVVFQEGCMVCYRCWHVCPQDAVSIQFSPKDGFIERTLYSNRMERRFGNIGNDEIIGPNLYTDVLSRKIKLKYDRHNPTAEFEYRQ